MGPTLARKAVVLVSTNFRLGALGFMAHPALTAESPHHALRNYGILDQIAALEWGASQYCPVRRRSRQRYHFRRVVARNDGLLPNVFAIGAGPVSAWHFRKLGLRRYLFLPS